MASEKILELKKQQVATVTEWFKGSIAGVVVDYKGISVEADTKLRKELREANVRYVVLKNTILRRAAEEAELGELNEVFKGTTAIAFSEDDYTAAARILAKYAKEVDSFSIKGGFMDGTVVDLATVEKLATLPTREVLLSMLCNVLNAPIAKLARAVQAVADKGGEAAPAEEAKAEEAPAEEAPAEEAKAEEAPAEEAKAEEAPAEEAKAEDAPAEETPAE
ncbi:MAG: 50S ribosomal protein L10 [Clostridia bacterium]|nr:50S ribosomal protein L10 [Clostridia bacterium]